MRHVTLGCLTGVRAVVQLPAVRVSTEGLGEPSPLEDQRGRSGEVGGGRGRSVQNVFMETSADAPHQQGAVHLLHQALLAVLCWFQPVCGLVSSSDFSSESPPGVCVSLPSHTTL